ncbi:MAG: TIGR01777 family oxidoreductase [Verrucomicrobiota bacterium]
MAKIILAGGSGFLGHALSQWFSHRNGEVVILARTAKPSDKISRTVVWDAKNMGEWAKELDGSDAVINLTGRSVDCRYNEKNRREITESRVDSTRVLGEAIARCGVPPKVWLNSSTATIYKYSFDTARDEESEIASAREANDEFSVSVAKAWEKAFDEANTPDTRKVTLRTTMVLGERGGVFPVLRRLTRLGLGGKMGSGRQYVSWIHERDFCRAIDWLIERKEFSGAVNMASPQPLPNAEMMKTFREIFRAPIGLPATDTMLEIGAFFLRTETELILKSRRVISKRLPEAGFTFEFPTFRGAIENLSHKLA